MTASILSFAALAVVVVLMPGADTVLVLRTALRAGASAALLTALGVVCGPILWGALVGLGVAILLSRSVVLYSLVALLGAAYLVFLGIGGLRAARQHWAARPLPERTVENDGPTRASGSFFLTGLMTNLLNPKIGVFYLAVMPGLFPSDAVSVGLGVLLGAIHAGTGLLYLAGVAVFASAMRRFLTRPAANAVIELLCAICLWGFAAFVVIDVVTSALAS